MMTPGPAFRLRVAALSTLLALPLGAAEGGAPAPATAGSTGTTAPAPASKEGQWKLIVDRPAADGSTSVSALLRSDAPIPSGFSKVTPSLVLRYRLGRASAFVVFDTFLGNGTLDATVTFGTQPPEQQKWRISADGRTAFVPGDALAFIERLKGVGSFTIRIAPRPDRPLTVSFSPRETDLVVKALLSAGVKYGN